MRLETGRRSDRRRFAARALLAACGAACAAAPAASASWSTPAILRQDAGASIFAAAGDPTGRAFLVSGGSQGDVPLLLAERLPGETGAGLPTMDWGPARPLDGSELPFTTSGLGRSALRGAAAGAGAAAIAFRVQGSGGDQLAALIRDPGEEFGPAKRILSAARGWIGDPAVAVSPGGTAAVAFAAQKATSTSLAPGGARPEGFSRGYASVIVRVAGDPWSRIRTLTRAFAGPPAVAVGADERPVVAWLRGSRVEASLLGEDGKPGPVRRVGGGRTGGRVAVAAGTAGRAVIAWADANRIVRVARRSGTRFGRGVRVQDSAATRTSGMTAVIDSRGRVFVAWRDGTDDAAQIVVAQASRNARGFQVTTVATGAALGDPALTVRPAGGAVVAWRAPEGWSAAASTRTGSFESPSAVSAALGRGDETLRVPAVLAGPGTSVDLVWLQNLVNVPVPGPAIMWSFGDA